jgi:hypothetical protein
MEQPVLSADHLPIEMNRHFERTPDENIYLVTDYIFNMGNLSH